MANPPPLPVASAPRDAANNTPFTAWDDDLLLDWSAGAPPSPTHHAAVAPPTKQSLLSFLSTCKHKGKEDATAAAADKSDFHLDHLEPQSGRCRLWQPDNHQQADAATAAAGGSGGATNDDMWTDVLETVQRSDDMYLDPTLIENMTATDILETARSPPPLKACDEGDAFFCSLCERKLTDKKNYEKHLQSELHLKRSGGGNSSKTTKESRFVTCLSCRSTVESEKFGKHLISHFHHHRSLAHKDTNTALVLQNIHAIVKEAPFQVSK